VKTTPLLPHFRYGFALSVPLAITLLFGFSAQSTSNEANNAFLLVVFAIGVLTLPGSLVLLVAGFMAAFSGELGEVIAVLCMGLSVVNAHLMGMVYARALIRRAAMNRRDFPPLLE
jgi:hypothetical protein